MCKDNDSASRSTKSITHVYDSSKPQSVAKFPLAYADENPLSPEQQRKLRSKYLLDDDAEETNCKRNNRRSRSTDYSCKTTNKLSDTSLHQKDVKPLSPRNPLSDKFEKTPKRTKDQNAGNVNITEENNNTVANLPPVHPSSHMNKKKSSITNGSHEISLN